MLFMLACAALVVCSSAITSGAGAPLPAEELESIACASVPNASCAVVVVLSATARFAAGVTVARYGVAVHERKLVAPCCCVTRAVGSSVAPLSTT